MLSSIHPLGERVRGNRFWLTAAAFIVGSVLGGATLGAVLGSLGGMVRLLLPWSARAALALLAVGALVALASDLRLGPVRLPTSRRQVDEDWLDRYRGWVYGLGFGFQLGFGFLTIVTTGAVHLTFLAALLAGSARTGLVIGAVFGLGRGVALLPASAVRTPERLVALHRRVAGIDGPARVATVAGLAIVAIVLGGASTGVQ